MNARPSGLSTIAAISRLGATAVLLRPDGDLASEVAASAPKWLISDLEQAIPDPIPGVTWCVLGGGTAPRTLPSHVADMERIEPDEVETPAAVLTPDQPWSLPLDRPDVVDLKSLLEDPTRHVRPAKIVRTAQLVAENRAAGRKTVVWSNFVANISALTVGLAQHNPAVITGATALDNTKATTDRRRQLEKFRHDTECWVLIATPQTLGEGVSLHLTAVDQVHVDRGFAAGTWLQAIDRTHRLGMPSDASPTCTVVLAAKTIDERVSDVLNTKVEAMAAALDDHTLGPVADPLIVDGDPVAAMLGDVDALRELLRATTSGGLGNEDVVQLP